jgi:hypothetical protein
MYSFIKSRKLKPAKYTFRDKSLIVYNFFVVKGPAADATDAPQPSRLIVQPYDEDD